MPLRMTPAGCRNKSRQSPLKRARDHFYYNCIAMDGSYRANWVRCLLAAVVTASIANLVYSCTSPICRPGPVLIYFHSPNCTGERVYMHIFSRGYLPTCNNDPAGSSMHNFTDQYIEHLIFNGAQNCPSDWEHVIGSRHYNGVCFKHGSGSQIRLSNVNQTFVSPQITDDIPKDLPVYQPGHFECSDPESCSKISSYFERRFDNASCSSESSKYFVRANATLNTCYKYDFKGASSVMLRCMGPHTMELVAYYDSDCKRLSFSEFVTSKCGVGGASTTVYCDFVDTVPQTMPYPTFEPSLIPEAIPSPTSLEPFAIPYSPIGSPIESPTETPFEPPTFSPPASSTSNTTQTSGAAQLAYQSLAIFLLIALIL